MEDFQFTQLFLNYNSGLYVNSAKIADDSFYPQAHPFTFFQAFYEAYGYPGEIFESQKATQHFIAVKTEEEQSFARLELEASLLFQADKSNYINECLKILIDLLQQFSLKEKTLGDNYDSITLNSVENLFLKTSRRYPLLLNAYSKNHFNFLTTLEKPLHAFKFTKFVSDELFSRLFNDHIRYGRFVNWNLKPYEFRTLFDGGHLEKKINWIDHKNSLCYLIKLLNKHKVIKKHEFSHWQVVSEFFLLKGEPIRSDKLLNQPPPHDKTKCLNLENFVKQL